MERLVFMWILIITLIYIILYYILESSSLGQTHRYIQERFSEESKETIVHASKNLTKVEDNGRHAIVVSLRDCIKNIAADL